MMIIRRHRRAAQQGLTLVELMVALTLGTIVIAGVVQFFLSGQNSYRLQKGLGVVQDSGRTAIFFLHRGLRVAGLPLMGRPPFMPLAVVNRDDAGNLITFDGDDNVNDPDAITVMYQSDTNCLGQQTNGYPGGQQMVDAFGNFYAKDQYFIDVSVLGDAESNENPLSLRCRALGLDGSPIDGRTAALVDGVEDLQILYGVDRLPAPPAVRDFQPDAYLNATAVEAAGQWARVVSIRFSVLVHSIDNALDEPSEHRYRLLDAPAHEAFDDRRLRRVFRSTVELRNQTP